MKITIIIDKNPFSQSSASANRWLTLIEGLAMLGSRVKLLIYGGYSSRNELNNWGKKGEKNGVIYQYVSLQLIEGYWKKRFDIYIGKKLNEGRLMNVVINSVDKDADIIWTDSSLFGIKLAHRLKNQGSSAKLFLEMSEFLDIHNNNKGNFLQRREGNKRHRFFDTQAFYAYDFIALMTNTLMEHYRQFPNGKAKLLHLPMTVDLDRFNKNVKTVSGFVQPYIAFVGVMNDAKDGVSILINAFAKITQQFPKYKLYLIGAWNYDTPFHQKLIKELKLEDKVFWKGEFNRNQIPSIIKSADLLVLSRPDSRQAQGGFPTKLGEYLATSNPVCVTRVGEIPDYLEDNVSAFMAEPGDVDSFADAMSRALSDKENAHRVGLNGRKVAEANFSADVQAKRLFEFLEENK